MNDYYSSIQTYKLTKKYGYNSAVEKLNLKLNQNEIYGFLGPNGAGKTTTIRMLLGLISPTSGKINILNHLCPPYRIDLRKFIGVVNENPIFPEKISALSYLQFFSEYYEIKNKKSRCQEVLEIVNLLEVKDVYIDSFSTGMKKRLSIAKAILHDPKILLLDEPISGLDPLSIDVFRDLILEMKNRGCSILFSTHALNEIEQIADRVGIISKGKMIFEGNLDELNNVTQKSIIIEIELQKISEIIIEKFKSLKDIIKKIEVDANKIKIFTSNKTDIRLILSKIIFDNGGVILGMNTEQISLEEAFRKLVYTK